MSPPTTPAPDRLPMWGETWLVVGLLLAPIALILITADGVQFTYVDRPWPSLLGGSGPFEFDPGRTRGALIALVFAGIAAAIATIPLLNSTRITRRSAIRVGATTGLIVFLAYPGMLSLWMAEALDESRLWGPLRHHASTQLWLVIGSEWRTLTPYLARSALTLAAALAAAGVLLHRHRYELGRPGTVSEQHAWVRHLPRADEPR